MILKIYSYGKGDAELIPVFFSDTRIKERMRNFPSRQTYIDCGDMTLTSVKHSHRDRTKVAFFIQSSVLICGPF